MKHACFLDVAWNETAFDSPKIAKAIVANAHASGYVRCLKHVAGRENGFCVRFRRAGFCDFLTPTLPGVEVFENCKPRWKASFDEEHRWLGIGCSGWW